MEKIDWKSLTWKNWLALAVILYMAFSGCWFVLGKAGLVQPLHEPRARSVYTGFDNNACLNRYQEKYRRADPLIPDETLFSDVARACVVERGEFEANGVVDN